MAIESPISPELSPWFEVVPIPSWPWELSPQQVTSPLSRMAQEKSIPAVICCAVLPVGSSTAAMLAPISPESSPTSEVLPIPSWPWELSPQQYASPLENRAQEWSQPMAKETGVAEVTEGVIEVVVE